MTEEICVPILEKESGLKCDQDFKLAYSPERINPGDKVNRLETIVKIVSGMDDETLDTVAKVYELVIDAAGSKWNFIKMNPGLVGGHCIGVDPYYLIHKAKEIGVESHGIASGRKINDGMAKYVAENTVKSLIKADKVAVLGITYKEDFPDTRNTKFVDSIKELKEYEIEVVVTEPVADKNELREEYALELSNIEDIDGVILAVSHNEYRKMCINDFSKLYCIYDVLDEVAADIQNQSKSVFIDIKGIIERDNVDK